MAKHGTRTMYVHYGCRCEACCKAEHEQYLKRPEAQKRRRNYSKHGDIPYCVKEENNRKRNRERWKKVTEFHGKPIHWSDLVDLFDMKCAICGCDVDPGDIWVNDNGRKCFGRKYPTVDHVIPLKYGGTDTFDNVQLACKRCNSVKGTRLAVCS